jgi:hypothetical protein
LLVRCSVEHVIDSDGAVEATCDCERTVAEGNECFCSIYMLGSEVTLHHDLALDLIEEVANSPTHGFSSISW